MSRANAKLVVIILVAAAIRIFFAIGLPLTGEEIGIAVLQATGQAVSHRGQLPDEVADIGEIEKFIRYSKSHTLNDVFRSLRYAGMHPPLYLLFRVMGSGWVRWSGLILLLCFFHLCQLTRLTDYLYRRILRFGTKSCIYML